MNTSLVEIDGLCRLQAVQFMSTPVQTVHENWSVKRLIRFLQESRISGAPVVGGDGSVVGVVSVSDIVRFENLGTQDKLAAARLDCYNEYVGYQLTEEDVQSLVSRADENCTVNAIMTPTVIAVAPSASLPEIACIMRERNIHRVFVQDGSRVVGVVSTSNILEVISRLCDCSL